MVVAVALDGGGGVGWLQVVPEVSSGLDGEWVGKMVKLQRYPHVPCT